MASRLKKCKLDISSRDKALTWIDGNVITSDTHAHCISSYIVTNFGGMGLNDLTSRAPLNATPEELEKYYFESDIKDVDMINENINQIVFGHIVGNNIYLEKDGHNIDSNYYQTVCNDIKAKFPEKDIYIENYNNLQDSEKIARLKKTRKADMDSTYVSPNGVIWNDTIWDTYNSDVKNKSSINREWKFEEPIDNTEWILRSKLN